MPTKQEHVLNKLTTENAVVTPEQARKWLERNHPENRKLNWNHVETLAQDIRSGNWELTHQGVAFDKDDFLIDGQHRLNAIVLVGKPVPLMVTRYKEGSIKGPVDRGQTRSLSYLTGFHARTIAALNVLQKLEDGTLYSNTGMTPAEAASQMDKHKAAFGSVGRLPNHAGLTGGVLAACVYTMPIDEAQTLDYLHKVSSGEMIRRGDPSFAFRSWKDRNRPTAIEVTLASLNCLRHHLNGQSLRSVYTTEMGYRAATTRRRALKVPNTPSVELVPTEKWYNFNSHKEGDSRQEELPVEQPKSKKSK